MITVDHTPREIIEIITDTLAEGDAEFVAKIASQVLIGDFKVAPHDENVIRWEYEV